MTTPPERSIYSTDQIAALQSTLIEAGVSVVIGTVFNPAGLILAKTTPIARLDSFHLAGMGASPVWNLFCIDNAISASDFFSGIGDLRLRLDLDALKVLGDGYAWAPTEIYYQDGTPFEADSRGVLRSVVKRLAAAGLTAKVGHELEFFLTDDAGQALTGGWAPYGVSGVLERNGFVVELVEAAAAAGIPLEQIHAEYGHSQFEFSLPPLDPIAAADALVLARILVGRVSRAHGLRASFSPLPFSGGIGNGSHQHISLFRDGAPLFAEGDGPYGITDEGGSAIAGFLGGLADVQGVLAGSVISGLRLAPGLWSGSYVCWGMENREASLRFLAGGPSNPHGSHVELKVGDPSSNAYFGTAALLGIALDGIERGAALPAEVQGILGAMSQAELLDRQIPLLPTTQEEIIEALHASTLARSVLGDLAVEAIVGVRRHEIKAYGEGVAEELIEKFRLAWSA